MFIIYWREGKKLVGWCDGTVDFNWSPRVCISCQLVDKCTSCIHLIGQDVDLRSITLYTKLPELWELFQKIIAISPMNEIGFTMVGADSILRDYDKESLQISHNNFWKVMIYFLSRVNDKFMERKKMRQMRRR